MPKIQPDSPAAAPTAPPVPRHEREALISLIALLYIEEHALLNQAQFASARRGLDALLVETSGESTMLRKLIDTLAAQKAVDQTFGELARVLDGIDRGFHSSQRKIDRLKHRLSTESISAEEHDSFVGPFLEFGHGFTERLDRFRRLMNDYLRAREQEARTGYVFEIARAAREQLKHRFDRTLHEHEPQREAHVAQVVGAFDYSEAETDHEIATHHAGQTRAEIEEMLNDFHEMCQYAMSPDRRDPNLAPNPLTPSPYPDVFSLYTGARDQYDNLNRLAPDVQELLRLFQHAYGICRLDFDGFERALGGISRDTEGYFRKKHEDEDARSIRRKLEMIESLILFLERCLVFLSENEDHAYATFSRTVSDTIMSPGAAWKDISDELLRMKVNAEAELNTRLA